MRQLLLLRHAKAVSDDPALPDHGRPLHPAGQRDCIAMRDEIRRRKLAVDVVLVSSARRTMQTMLGVAPAIAAGQVEPMDLLYLASATDILRILQQVTPTLHSALLIGHNPGIHDLALLLTAGGVKRSAAEGAALLEDAYPTLGLAQFVFDGEWAALDQGGAQLVAFLTPASVRGRGGVG